MRFLIWKTEILTSITLVSFIIAIFVVEGSVTSTNPKGEDAITNDSEESNLVSSLYLLSESESKNDSLEYPSHQIEFINDTTICNNNDTICIPKCCPMGEVRDFNGTHGLSECQDSGGVNWIPMIHFQDDTPPNERKQKRYYYYHKKDLKCPGKFFLSGIHQNAFSHDPQFLMEFESDKFHILPNGTVESEGLLTQDENKFCLDGVQNFGNGVIPPKYSGNHASHVILRACFPTEGHHDEIHKRVDTEKRLYTLVYWIFLPSASLFLVAIIVTYILVWEVHNIHGHTLFSYVCCMFGNYAMLFISQIEVVPRGTKLCGLLGLSTHFLFLATAAWLTIVNYDVWRTFRHLKAGRRTRSFRRYLVYCMFAVGIPLVIVISSGILDAWGRKEDLGIILPKYREDCILSDKAQPYYLYIPLASFILCNIVFFICTICFLMSYRRSIGEVIRGKSTAKEDQSLRLFLKLFVIMGCSWTFDFISWVIKQGINPTIVISAILVLCDILNLLLAIPIFFIFVWKKSIFDSLWIQYPSFRKPLSLLVRCGCVSSIPDDKRSSLSAITLSSFGRNGNGTVKSNTRRPSAPVPSSCRNSLRNGTKRASGISMQSVKLNTNNSLPPTTDVDKDMDMATTTMNNGNPGREIVENTITISSSPKSFVEIDLN